jgi:hypothetical protein
MGLGGRGSGSDGKQRRRAASAASREGRMEGEQRVCCDGIAGDDMVEAWRNDRQRDGRDRRIKMML